MFEYSRRALFILKHSNVFDLFKRSFTYFVFDWGTYNLYEHHVADVDVSLFSPVISGFKVKIVSNNRDADELSSDCNDFRKVIFKSRDMLNKGAVAFCIYSGNDLAHISWLATSIKAQKAIATMPYQIDFTGGQAGVGGTYTDPRFRGKGLMVYGNYLKFKYLKSVGATILKHAIKSTNIASITGYARFSPVMRARYRYFKIFCYRYWKEIPSRN